MSLDLDAIERRLDAATPGPWETVGGTVAYYTGHCNCGTNGGPYGHERGCGLDMLCELGLEPSTDATFIAHARTDVADLLAEVRRLRAATVAAPVVGVATDGPAGDRDGYEGGGESA